MPGPGLKRHEAVRLGGRRVDDLPDVDAHAVAEHRDLVDERDVDRPEDVLEQLGELRDLERRDGHDLLADRAVERAGALEALRRHAADDLRRRAQREVGAARVDALGREGEVERAAGLQARLLEQRRQPLPRRARVGGRLEDDELALLEHAGQRGAGGDERLQIGLAVRVERRRHRDDDGVDLGQRRVARRRVQAIAHGRQPLRGDVLDVAACRPRSPRSWKRRRRARRRRGRPRRTRPPAAARRSRVR